MATPRTIQLYATGSSTANAVAQITIPSQTIIKGVIASLAGNSVTDDGIAVIECSKVATSQIATNGALDPFLEMRFYSNFVTSGLSNGAFNQFFPLHVPCRQGEIVYLHAFVSGTCVYFFNGIFLY